MGHLRNGSLYHGGPTRFAGGISYLTLNSTRVSQFGAHRNFWAGEATNTAEARRNGFPVGYSHPTTWILPPQQGGMSSRDRASGTATSDATLAEGRALDATEAGTSSTSATLSAVYELAGTSAGVASTSADASLAVAVEATAAGTTTTSAALTYLQAMSATAAGTSTATAPPEHLVELEASVEFTTVGADTLTANEIAAAVWDSVATSFDSSGTMGRLLNDSGAAAANKIELDYLTGVLTVYAADGTTVRSTFQMRDRNGDASSTEQMTREPT